VRSTFRTLTLTTCALKLTSAFVRSQFGVVPDTFTQAELLGKAFNDGSTVLKTPAGVEVTAATVAAGSVTQDVLDAAANVVETKPHFYAWATATTGMLSVARKQRSTFRTQLLYTNPYTQTNKVQYYSLDRLQYVLSRMNR
jgi:hypothetical protein